jgi:hypothetical protein
LTERRRDERPPLYVTVKLEELVPVPIALVTEIGPLTAPAGTVVEICVSETTLKVALTLPNLTVLAPLKFEPVIVTGSPTAPEDGLNEVTVGATSAVTV